MRHAEFAEWSAEMEENARDLRRREKLLADFRESSNVPSRNDWHTVDSLADRLKDLRRVLKAWGWTSMRILPKEGVFSFDGRLDAIPFEVVAGPDQTARRGWITMEFGEDGSTARYRNDVNGETMDTITVPERHKMQWLEETSRRAKIVKSRPRFLYEELLGVPHAELWPPDAKVAVIGDPFQACDVEGATIVEYEYAEEILPPLLHAMINGEEPNVEGWFRSFYYEDIESLDRIHGMYTLDYGNPYLAHVRRAFELCQRLGEKIIAREHADISVEKAELARLRALGKKLIEGTWQFDEAKDWFDDEKSLADLREWHARKQAAVEQMGNPKEWERFVSCWNEYLDGIPMDELRGLDRRADDKVKQARHWVSVLPESKSAERVTKGLNELSNLYFEWRAHYDENLPSRAAFDNALLEDATDKSFGFFGYFVPGFAVSRRTRNIIEEGLARAEQMVEYHETLMPHLRAEIERLQGVPFDRPTALNHMKSYERAWARQHFFRKRTQRAVPIHGFFPHDMPGIDPQDRIVALTSVSMHGFNRLKEDGFRDEILASLPFLKTGGKYILGPINQYVYFRGYADDFDAEGLSRALAKLKAEGKIDYTFVKGMKERYDDGEAYRDEPPDQSDWDPDPSVLHDHESARSLMITKLE
jgi:hypothetical protein